MKNSTTGLSRYDIVVSILLHVFGSVVELGWRRRGLPYRSYIGFPTQLPCRRVRCLIEN